MKINKFIIVIILTYSSFNFNIKSHKPNDCNDYKLMYNR